MTKLIAMAILAMSLMAIFDLSSGAVSSHAYTKRLTVASLTRNLVAASAGTTIL